MKESKSKGKPARRWLHQRQVGATKAPQRVPRLILLGFGVQVVIAECQEISMHCTIEKDLFPALRAESGDRLKRMELFVNGDWKREVFGKKKKRKTASERTQGPFKQTASPFATGAELAKCQCAEGPLRRTEAVMRMQQ